MLFSFPRIFLAFMGFRLPTALLPYKSLSFLNSLHASSFVPSFFATSFPFTFFLHYFSSLALHLTVTSSTFTCLTPSPHLLFTVSTFSYYFLDLSNLFFLSIFHSTHILLIFIICLFISFPFSFYHPFLRTSRLLLLFFVPFFGCYHPFHYFYFNMPYLFCFSFSASYCLTFYLLCL